MVVCSVLRLQEELKHTNTLKCDSEIFRFINYCLQLNIIDDFLQLFVPKSSIMWEMSLSKLKKLED